jgi:hypothetical protein
MAMSSLRLPRISLRGGMIVVAFSVVALSFVVPALPGTGHVLGGQDLLFFRPPLTELRPAGVERASNALLADPVEVFHPDLSWVADEVRDGRLPLWNPNVGSGWPQLASQQTALLFPLTALAYVAEPSTVIGLIAALRILIAALGTYLFCRRALALGTAGAACASIAFAAGTYMVSWLEHPHGNVYALLPWLLLCVDRTISRPTVPSAAALGAALGLSWLGGHPQSVVVCSFLVVPFALWRLLAERDARGARLRAVLLLAAGAAAGTAAAAVVLLPLAEFIGESATQQRGGLGGISWTSAVTVALPDFWGRPDAAAHEWGALNYFERTIYIGTPALLLAIAGLAARPVPRQWFFAVSAVVATVLACRTPGVTSIIDTLPPFSLVAMPRALMLATFCLAVLSGYGLQQLLSASHDVRRRMVVAMAVTALLPVVYAVLARGGGLEALRDGLPALPAIEGQPDTRGGMEGGAVLRWTVLAALTLAVVAIPRRGRVVAACVLVLLAVDLVDLGRGLHPIIDRQADTVSPTGPLALAMRSQGHQRTTGDDFYLVPNMAQRFGLRDPRVRGQPTIERVDTLFFGYAGTTPRFFDVDAPGAGGVLDAFGVSQVLTGGTGNPPDPDLSLAASSLDDKLFRNAAALPRAYLAGNWRPAPDKAVAATATVNSTAEELRTAPVVEGVDPPSRPGPGGTATFVEDGASRVTIDVVTASPGRLVLLDAYYPGWHATVDGRDVPIAATNLAFRSVAVPAGRSRVAFEYRPATVYAGAAISVLAGAALLAALLAGGIRRRRGHRAKVRAR